MSFQTLAARRRRCRLGWARDADLSVRESEDEAVGPVEEVVVEPEPEPGPLPELEPEPEPEPLGPVFRGRVGVLNAIVTSPVRPAGSRIRRECVPG